MTNIEREGQNLVFQPFNAPDRGQLPCDFWFGFTRCEGCNFFLVPFYVALEAVSRTKMREIVGRVEAVVSTQVGFRSSIGIFFLVI